MAQYDLLLTQNVAAAGIEFTEQYAHLNKGSLLSSDSNHVPSVLPVGTDTYMLVADSNETTGLKWVAVAAGHTQNADTGTTGNTFTIDSDSTTGKITLDVALNAGENHTMTITNAVMVDDVTITLPATTGTVALTSQLHTQNTDTGTTGTSFAIDSDGYDVDIVAESASKIGLKVHAGTYADLQVKDLIVNDLTVNGTNTIINSTTLTVDDKNIELGSVTTPDDTTADGGGITLKGATDKSIIWDNANDNWTLNQNVNIPTGTTYKINNTSVLSSTQVLGVTLGTAAAAATGDFATAAQGSLATNAIPKGTLTEQGDILYASAASTPAALAHGDAGQVLQSGGNAANPSWLTLGTMAAATTTDYVAKSLFDAQTILHATSDHTPVALTVGEQTIVGRKTSGNIAALTGTEVINIIWQTAPATKTSTGTAGMIAKDTNWFYICTATDTWKRSPITTNWT